MKLTRTDKVYLAGYFDADGSVSATVSGSGSVSIRAGLSGRNYELFATCKKVYGGTDYKSPEGNAQWSVNALAALAFLQDIEPFVRYKKVQVRLAVNILRMGGKPENDSKKLAYYMLAFTICKENQSNLSKPKRTKTMETLHKELLRLYAMVKPGGNK